VSIPSRAAGCRGHAEGHFLCEQRVYPVATACGNGKRAVSVVLLAAFVTGENDSVYSAFLPRTNRNFQLSQEARKHAHGKNSCFRACLLGTTNLAQLSNPSRATDCCGQAEGDFLCGQRMYTPVASGPRQREAGRQRGLAGRLRDWRERQACIQPFRLERIEAFNLARRHEGTHTGRIRAFVPTCRDDEPGPALSADSAKPRGATSGRREETVSQFLDATALPDMPTLARHD